MKRLINLLLAFLAGTPCALATTYEVGPGKPFVNLQAVAPLLAPGDLVLVSGNTTYPGGIVLSKHGTAAAPITVRGVRINNNRPVLSGGTNTIEFRANHYIFEGFEVTGGSFRGIYHHGDNITIRDCLVRDCPAHGILGADSDSGSLLLEYTEVRNCGNGTTQHQIYMATDNTVFPNAVFRMQYCYVHHATGGNSVKSRAGRNEIYYNWIEGGQYHELELIGADGQVPALVREDSDVVGNVLIKYNNWGTFITRIGGDGTGTSMGRHRFAWNTIILAPTTTAAVFRLFDNLQSFEAHNNVIYRLGGGTVKITDTSGLSIPLSSVAVSGTNNWIPAGSTLTPSQWVGTLTGANPFFENSAANNFTPAAASPLLNNSAAPTQSPAGFPFPNPLQKPFFEPPIHTALLAGFATARSVVGIVDIGAIERPGPVLLGSGEDLQLLTFINNVGSGLAPLKVAFIGDAIRVEISSPGQTFTGAFPLLAGQVFPTGYTPGFVVEYPELHMDIFAIESLYDPFSAPPPNTGILPSAGITINAVAQSYLSGYTVRLQALAAAPIAANGIFATSDVRDLRIE